MEPEERQILHYTEGKKDLFGEWLDNLYDAAGRAAVHCRLNRVRNGNFGDYRGVGQGVWELRIHYGPGYRIYFGEDGPRIILLICGGDKRTQQKDIRKARRIWAEYRSGK